ncbi:MAG: hypothetical protein RRB22_12330 [Gammaproteobacteria bacterium]|nr:hypothetical protein [Gammaproteobacteria bacterium]
MVGFFKKVFSSAEGKVAARNRAGADNASQPLAIARLMELFRYFPLGEKIRYFPEYQEKGALDTIVLGYSVNDLQIFSPIDIRCQQDGERDVFRLMVEGQERQVQTVDSFSLLIPVNQDDENKRDYMRRAELGPRGPFRRQNIISLLACSRGGTLSQVDTEVRKVLSLTSGIYAGHDVVVLDVLPDTLRLTDQRQHYRLQTDLPASLTIKDGETHDCVLMDFSEESAQLLFAKLGADIRALTEYRRLTLNFDVPLDGRGKSYSLDGVMYRRTDNSLVMKLQGIYNGGKLRTMGLVDILDIKASLLQHPATQQALQNQRNA